MPCSAVCQKEPGLMTHMNKSIDECVFSDFSFFFPSTPSLFAHLFTQWFTHSFTLILPAADPLSYTASLVHSLTRWLVCSLRHSVTPWRGFTPSQSHSFTGGLPFRSLISSLPSMSARSLIRSLPHSRTQSHTSSLTLYQIFCRPWVYEPTSWEMIDCKYNGPRTSFLFLQTPTLPTLCSLSLSLSLSRDMNLLWLSRLLPHWLPPQKKINSKMSLLSFPAWQKIANNLYTIPVLMSTENINDKQTIGKPHLGVFHGPWWAGTQDCYFKNQW